MIQLMYSSERSFQRPELHDTLFHGPELLISLIHGPKQHNIVFSASNCQTGPFNSVWISTCPSQGHTPFRPYLGDLYLPWGTASSFWFGEILISYGMMLCGMVWYGIMLSDYNMLWYYMAWYTLICFGMVLWYVMVFSKRNLLLHMGRISRYLRRAESRCSRCPWDQLYKVQMWDLAPDNHPPHDVILL